jgi:hypothetical protein
MYVIRRIAKTQPGKAWEVAGYLTKITQAYEEAGRNTAQVYIQGQGVPGEPNIVYAEWTQERIEPVDLRTVPEAVRTYNAKMQELLTEYTIEFYEMVTPEKLEVRGFN